MVQLYNKFARRSWTNIKIFFFYVRNVVLRIIDKII